MPNWTDDNGVSHFMEGKRSMSLTRAQWEELWQSTVRLELLIKKGIPVTGIAKGKALQEIQLQRDLIQSVIGQMQ